MSTATLVSVEEYLATSYEDGDREYVDGEVLGRNLGEIDHSDLQSAAVTYLRTRYRGLVWSGVELRVQVKSSRFRVPDVTVVLGAKPSGRIITSPPFIVIEVLSPEDRADRMQTKIGDYLEFGVGNVWVLDPETKTAVAYTREGVTPVSEGALRTAKPVIELPLLELF
jgi:Uma2 family endonuclease